MNHPYPTHLNNVPIRWLLDFVYHYAFINTAQETSNPEAFKDGMMSTYGNKSWVEILETLKPLGLVRLEPNITHKTDRKGIVYGVYSLTEAGMKVLCNTEDSVSNTKQGRKNG